MHDLLSSLDVFVVLAPELPEVEPIVESTSTMVMELLAMMLNPDGEPEPEVRVEPKVEDEMAATDEVEAARVAPKPEANVEVVGALQVLPIVPPFEVRASTSRMVTTSLSSEAGPSSSWAMVPLGVPGAGEHDDTQFPPVANRERDWLIADPL